MCAHKCDPLSLIIWNGGSISHNTHRKTRAHPNAVGTEAAHTLSAQDTDMTITVGIQNCSDTDMDGSLL